MIITKCILSSLNYSFKYVKRDRIQHLFGKHPALWVLLLIWLFLWCANFCQKQFTMPPPLRAFSNDFEQYYAGAVVVDKGWWSDLYPIDLGEHATPMSANYSERLKDELAKRGVPSSTKYIFPPPFALFFWPYSKIDYRVAVAFHSLVSIFALITLLHIVESLFLKFRFSFRTTQSIVFLMGVSYVARHAVFSGNVSQWVGIGVAFCVSGMASRSASQTVLGCFLAGITKGAAAGLIPFIALDKHWKALALGTAMGIALVLATFAVGASLDTYKTFLITVVPAGRGTLYRCHPPNVGIPSAIAYLFPVVNSTKGRSLVLSVCSTLQLILLTALFFKLSRRKRACLCMGNDQAYLLVFSLFGMFALFSNICWYNYGTWFFALIPGFLAITKKRTKCWFSLACASCFVLWDPGFIQYSSKLLHCTSIEYVFTLGLSVCTALAFAQLAFPRENNLAILCGSRNLYVDQPR